MLPQCSIHTIVFACAYVQMCIWVLKKTEIKCFFINDTNGPRLEIEADLKNNPPKLFKCQNQNIFWAMILEKG